MKYTFKKIPLFYTKTKEFSNLNFTKFILWLDRREQFLLRILYN
jgi:hypothetical protein